MDNLIGLDFIPAGVNKGRKDILDEIAAEGIKPLPAVSTTMNTFTHGAGLPPFLCKPAPSFFWRAEREGDAANNRDSTGEKR